jgi:hypothetical protein
MTGAVESEELPLAIGQSRMFDALREDPALRMGMWWGFRIPGELDMDCLTDSVEILVSRHDALRIEIVERPGGEPRQRIRGVPPRADLISCQNVVARSPEQFSRYIRHIVGQEQLRKWELDAYPFRFRLFRYSPTVNALVVCFSHMALDGIGAEIAIRDLMSIYEDKLAGRTSRALPRRAFADSLLRWAAADGRGSPRTAQADPSDMVSATRFDVPPPDPGDPGCRSWQVSLSLFGTELKSLREQASLRGCTEFTWILAAFARTVFQFTCEDRIKIAVPVNMRGPAERDVVGMYLLVFPVVIERPRDADGGRGFVAGVGSALLRAMVRHRWTRQASGANLSVLYQKVLGDSRKFRLAARHYMPRVDYWTSGVGVKVFSYPAVLDVHVVLDSGVFSQESAMDVFEALKRNMTSDSGWSGRHGAG